MHPLADVAERLNLPRKQLRRMLDHCRVTHGKGFSLKDHDPAHSAGDLFDRAQADTFLTESVQRLSELQERLYAQNEWSLLCIFQAMDAAGKDGTIKHVLTGVNPQGVQVTSFKVPGPEDLAHDFLWRCVRVLPERGRIGIFNRSYYEEVLVVRVHPDNLARQHLPQDLIGKKVWEHRLEIDLRLRTSPRPPGHHRSQVLPASFEGGAAQALPRPARRTREELEVQRQRSRRARLLGRLPVRLPGRDRRDLHAGKPVVRRPGGPQMVHPSRRRRGDHRGARKARPAIPENHR